MTKEETAEVLAIVKAGMPSAYLSLTDADAKAMVMLWAEMFIEEPRDLVMAAAKTYIWNEKTSKFPTPGALREKMDEIERIIKHCACCGYTLFENVGTAIKKFPPVVQQYITKEYKAKHKDLYGIEHTGKVERMLAATERLLLEGRVTDDREKEENPGTP